MTQESLNAKKASYGYWASLPIVISILHLIGTVVLIAMMKQADDGGYLATGGMSMMFGSASLFGILASAGTFAATKAVYSIASLVVGLILIFISTRMVKTVSPWMAFVVLGLYAIDSLCLIPAICCSFMADYPLHFDVAQTIITVVIHAISLASLGYLVRLTLTLHKAGIAEL